MSRRFLNCIHLLVLCISIVVVFVGPLMIISCASDSTFHPLKILAKPRIDDRLGLIGDRYAIVIGVSEYTNPALSGGLPITIADANDIADVLESGGFEVSLITERSLGNIRLTGKPESPEVVMSEIRKVARLMDPEDLLLLYYSGHGGRAYNEEEDYIFFKDTDPDDPRAGSIALSGLATCLDSLGVKKTVFIIDACRRSVKNGGTTGTFSLEYASLWEGKAVLNATEPGKTTRPPLPGECDFETGEPIIHSPFTHFLLRGLKGEADGRDRVEGIISLDELKTYVGEKVIKQDPGLTPQSHIESLGGDLFIASVPETVSKESSDSSRKYDEGDDTALPERNSKPWEVDQVARVETFLPESYVGIMSYDGDILREREGLDEVLWSTFNSDNNEPYLAFLMQMHSRWKRQMRIERFWIAYKEDRRDRVLVFVGDRSLWEMGSWGEGPSWLSQILNGTSYDDPVRDYAGVEYLAFTREDSGGAYGITVYESWREDIYWFYFELDGYCIFAPSIKMVSEIVDLSQSIQGISIKEGRRLGGFMDYIDTRSKFWQCSLVNREEEARIMNVFGMPTSQEILRLAVNYDEIVNTRGRLQVQWDLTMSFSAGESTQLYFDRMKALQVEVRRLLGENAAERFWIDGTNDKVKTIGGRLFEEEVVRLEDSFRNGKFVLQWVF